MKELLLVALGGMLGASLRYLITLLVSAQALGAFPLATLFINLIGCLLIGTLYVNFFEQASYSWIKPLLMVGVLGGFTTFSSFSLESIQMFKEGRYAWVFLYVMLSNIGGLLLAWLGSQWVWK